MPEGAIYVGRPTVFGNPFPTGGAWTDHLAALLGYPADAPGARRASLALFRGWLLGVPVSPGPAGTALGAEPDAALVLAVLAGAPEPPKVPDGPPSLARIRAHLAGHDLVCWCRLDDPCHADLLLTLANGR
jgi:hypothetical protein